MVLSDTCVTLCGTPRGVFQPRPPLFGVLALSVQSPRNKGRPDQLSPGSDRPGARSEKV